MPPHAGDRKSGLMRKLDLRSGSDPARWLGLGLALLFLLTICACDSEEVIIPVPPTATPAVIVSPSPPTATPKPTSQPLAFPLAAPERISVRRADDRTCVDCHTNKQALQAAAEGARAEAQSTQDTGQWAAGPVQTEAWERVWLDQDLFFETLHGRYGCITCHGGTPDSSYADVAHQGLEAEPSAAGVCVDCHAEEVAGHEASLHANLAGYRTVLAARSSPNRMARLEEIMANHCDGCHTTSCGQCHITRAQSMGGGLVNGHLFEKKLPTEETCAGCHGSRIFTEYQGAAEGLTADVHWSQAEMQCFDCHSAHFQHEIHEAYPQSNLHHIKMISSADHHDSNEASDQTCFCLCHVNRIDFPVSNIIQTALIENPYVHIIPQTHSLSFYPTIYHPPVTRQSVVHSEVNVL